MWPEELLWGHEELSIFWLQVQIRSDGDLRHELVLELVGFQVLTAIFSWITITVTGLLRRAELVGAETRPSD